MDFLGVLTNQALKKHYQIFPNRESKHASQGSTGCDISSVEVRRNKKYKSERMSDDM